VGINEVVGCELGLEALLPRANELDAVDSLVLNFRA
jgi:hypothetical protein